MNLPLSVCVLRVILILYERCLKWLHIPPPKKKTTKFDKTSSHFLSQTTQNDIFVFCPKSLKMDLLFFESKPKKRKLTFQWKLHNFFYICQEVRNSQNYCNAPRCEKIPSSDCVFKEEKNPHQLIFCQKLKKKQNKLVPGDISYKIVILNLMFCHFCVTSPSDTIICKIERL